MKKNDPRIAMMQSLSLPFLVHGRSVGVEEDYPYLDVDNEAPSAMRPSFCSS